MSTRKRQRTSSSSSSDVDRRRSSSSASYGSPSSTAPPPPPVYKKNPAAPKRFRSAYILFCMDKKSDVARRLGNAKGSEITTELGKMWSATSESERAHWKDLAKKDMERYDRETREFTGPLRVPSSSSSSSSSSSGKSNRVVVAATPTPPPNPNPPPPSSAFDLYCRDNLDRVASENPGMPPEVLSKLLRMMWNDANHDVRGPFVRKAAASFGAKDENDGDPREEEEADTRGGNDDDSMASEEEHKETEDDDDYEQEEEGGGSSPRSLSCHESMIETPPHPPVRVSSTPRGSASSSFPSSTSSSSSSGTPGLNSSSWSFRSPADASGRCGGGDHDVGRFAKGGEGRTEEEDSELFAKSDDDDVGTIERPSPAPSSPSSFPSPSSDPGSGHPSPAEGGAAEGGGGVNLDDDDARKNSCDAPSRPSPAASTTSSNACDAVVDDDGYLRLDVPPPLADDPSSSASDPPPPPLLVARDRPLLAKDYKWSDFSYHPHCLGFRKCAACASRPRGRMH